MECGFVVIRLLEVRLSEVFMQLNSEKMILINYTDKVKWIHV